MKRTTQWLSVLGAAVLCAGSALGDGAGVVSQLRIDARGQLSGVILADGTEFVTPASEAETLRQSFRPGDHVSVHADGAGMYALESARAGRTVRAVGPAELARGGGPAERAGVRAPSVNEVAQLPRLVVRGRVQMVTHGPNGEPTGFVMQNGVQVHASPEALRALGVREGERLHVDGNGTQTQYGTGMMARGVDR